MYNEVIRDCDDCLKLDPTNIKAMFRKCDALIATDRKNAAYKQYTNILNIEPENEFANKALNDISLRYDIQTRGYQLENQSHHLVILFRLEIQDVNVQSKVRKTPVSQFLEFDENCDDFKRKLINPI